MSSRRPWPASSWFAHGERALVSGVEEGGPMRLDRSEGRVDSPRFHSHSDEPAVVRLGACWGPSSRGAAISVSVSVLLGSKRTHGGDAVAPDWAMDSDLLGILELTGLDVFCFDAVSLRT